MKILGLIASHTDPASRARILQYRPFFKESGHQLDCKYFTPLKDANPPSWIRALSKVSRINQWRIYDTIKSFGRMPLAFIQNKYDLIWQNRLLLIQHYYWESKLKKPVIFDFDDAIWINEGKNQVIKKLSTSQMVFAGNEYLATFALKHTRNVEVVPTTVDTYKLYPEQNNTGRFNIGWSGTESNFTYLENIAPILLNFLALNQDAQLIIVSSTLPKFFPDNHRQIIFQKWEAENENQFINQFDVGIMPLHDNEWTRGKCSYKLLQYLACGKPVIASPVGQNENILNKYFVGFSAESSDHWLIALHELMKNPTEAKALGQNGRRLVVEKYSTHIWANKISEFMKTIL